MDYPSLLLQWQSALQYRQFFISGDEGCIFNLRWLVGLLPKIDVSHCPCMFVETVKPS
jgi:hypothetical protein